MKLECADPNAPIEKCLNCEATIYTCERTVAIYNSYTCPVHKDGFETVDGNWFCNSQCYNQYFNVENK
jgi:hypothetical protein